VKVDGSLWCWGDNTFGQLGLGDNAWRTTPQMVAGITDVVSVSLGDYHTCALKRDGSLWCWGRNNYGQLGLGDDDNRNKPQRVLGGVIGGGGGAYPSPAPRYIFAFTDNVLISGGSFEGGSGFEIENLGVETEKLSYGCSSSSTLQILSLYLLLGLIITVFALRGYRML